MRIPIYINRNSRIRRSIKKNNIKLDKQAVGLIPVQAKYINKFIRTKIKLRLKSPSRNRRVCNQILTQNRDTTPERQNNWTYQHVFKTKETVKLTLVDTGDMHQSIRDALKRFLKALTKSDSSATLMPWVTKSHLKELYWPEEIPHMINSMRSYVNKLFVPGEGNNRVMYPHMMIGHDVSLEDLKEKLSSWMRETNSGLYYKML